MDLVGPFALFPWQHAAVRERLAGRASWPHALLVHGPAGFGERELVRHLAAALLCEQPGPDGGPCGQCASCHYLSIAGHPDLRWLEPAAAREDAADAGEEGRRAPSEHILIEQVREVVEAFVPLTAHRRGAKVVVIDPADALNPPAANALLKTLEEPPPGTHFLLLARALRRLPATIVSRCQRLPVPRPTPEQARAWLEAQGVESPASLLAQAGGAPATALALAAGAVQGQRRAFLDALARPETLSPVAEGGALDALPRAERKAALRRRIDWLAAWGSDLARVRFGAAPAFNPDYAAELARLSAGVAPRRLFRYHRTLLREKALLAHPLNPRLVAEALLAGYRAAVLEGED